MSLAKRFQSLFGRQDVERGLNEELEHHIELKTQENIERGMSPEEARYAALREFGSVEQKKEECRDVDRLRWAEELFQDLRYGLRQLRRKPGFMVVAVLTLALGIGANTAIFSVVDAVLLRRLPFSNANQLVLVLGAPVQDPDALTGLSYRDFVECRKQNHAFSELAGNGFHDLTLTGAGEPSIVATAPVTPEIFSLLRAKPLAGRTFVPEDGKRGAAPVVVLSENLWRSRYGANPGLIGQSIILDHRSFTVVGIMPARFRYPVDAPPEDVWIPVAQDPLSAPLMTRPGVRLLRVIGRLKPGVSIAQAQAEMDALGARFAKEFALQDSGFTIRVLPYQQVAIGNAKSPLLILWGAVGLVLLIACANIANLLL
ncbi:MAG TPA: ABC transporter permease, partial [Terriglobia bacterium]|nr:ABC transporter permease [Terriglobia bacterium]